MDDSKAIHLFKQFLQARRELEDKGNLATYHDFLEHGNYPAIALPFLEMAKEHTQEVANTVNEFCHYLHSLAAWNQVLNSLTEDDRQIDFVSTGGKTRLIFPNRILKWRSGTLNTGPPGPRLRQPSPG